MNQGRRTFAELLTRPLMMIALLLVLAPVRAPSRAALPQSPGTRQATQQTVTAEVAKLLADDSAEDRSFGNTVDVSNDTIVVGAYKDNTYGMHSGAAYVFVRNKGGADEWNQVAKLTASDAAESAYFGYDVAISGDTIVVGAYGNNSSTGAFYIFERNQGGIDNWGQVRRLAGASTGDYFGEFVDVSGDTIVAGAPMKDTMAGAAYIFERNTGGEDNWGQVTELVPTTSADSDARFGWSVAISGGTAVVGAYYDGTYSPGSAYIFERNQGGADNWGEVQKIAGQDTANFDRFGYAVDIHVDTVVVGAKDHDDGGDETGAAYIFERNQGGADNWGQMQKLIADDTEMHDRFGRAVAVHCGSIIVGTPYVEQGSAQTGQAYLFARNRGGADAWGQVGKLAGGALEDGDYFGNGVAVSGRTIVAGAPQHDDVGTAYVFGRRGAAWRRDKKIWGDDTVGGDFFGSAVAVSGDTLVAGAPYEDDWGDYAGAAYVLARNEDGADEWGQVKRLSIASTAHGKLGSAVDISGDALLVGVPGDNRARICERNDSGADNWNIVRMISGASGTSFGAAVAISGDTVVVGAPNEDAQSHSKAGTAYVYARNQGGADNWGLVTKLDASLYAGDSDHFGQAVAISGDTIVVGAYYADHGIYDHAGAAYVFTRNRFGANQWGMASRLVADDGDGGERFGWSVAIDNDTIIVGAPLETMSGYGDGAAYVFERNWGDWPEMWGQVQKITAGAGGGGYFGWAVDLSFDVSVVGAYVDDSAASNAGAAYVFERNAGGVDNWGQMERITAADAAADDYFGESVSISGDVIAVGAKYDDDKGSGSGSVYVYRWRAAHLYLPLVLR